MRKNHLLSVLLCVFYDTPRCWSTTHGSVIDLCVEFRVDLCCLRCVLVLGRNGRSTGGRLRRTAGLRIFSAQLRAHCFVTFEGHRGRHLPNQGSLDRKSSPLRPQSLRLVFCVVTGAHSSQNVVLTLFFFFYGVQHCTATTAKARSVDEKTLVPPYRDRFRTQLTAPYDRLSGKHANAGLGGRETGEATCEVQSSPRVGTQQLHC